MPQKNSKLKTIKTPIGPIWVYSSVERAIRPLKKKDNLKIITAVGAVIIVLLTLLYAGFIDDRQGGKAFSGNGSGTPQDPFQIATCSQLQEMQQSLSSHYVLINDIDCSDTVNWNSGAGFVPVGPFSGTLDGRHRTIQNLNVISNTSEVGLFRIVGGVNASVKNLHLYKGVINNTSPSGSNYTGSVTGTLSGGAQIINVSSSANLSGLSSTGGIAGQIMNGSISQARYSGAITGNAGSNHNLGGIAGLMFQGSINDSYFSGEITHLNTLGIYANRCGGIVGQAANLQKSVNRTYSTGTITCNVGMNTVGGIVASANTSNETTINQSYAAARLISNSAVGAIAGSSNGAGAITHQDNVFDETRTTAANCEGFAAATSCTAINTAGSPAPNYFFGNSSAAPLNSWDFNVVWKTTSGGYPSLRTPPSVTTASATDLTQNLATLNGIQWSTLNTATTARGFEWGTDTNYGNTVNLTPSSPSNFTLASKVSGSGLNRPQDITHDANGNIYVTDSRYTTNNIKKYDANGILLGTIGNTVDQNWTGLRDGDLNAPNGIAIDTSGNIYVADTNNNRIQKFAANGTFLTKWGSAGSGDGQFNGPNSLTIDPSGNVYVTDSNNNRVQKFDANGSFITKWGTAGSGNSQFNVPRGITYDFLNSRILVVDTFNARIQEFTTNGAYLTQWGSYGSGNNQFAYPQKIHFSYSGSLYVTDSAGTSPGNQRVQEFITSSRFKLNEWGSYGNGNGEFIFAQGITLNSSNNEIYTVDYYNGRVQVFDESGNYLSQFGNTAFSAPDGVYVDALNNMYVQNDQLSPGVQKFDALGNYQYTIDQDWAQDDVAFDGLNNVYAVGTGGVRKYSPSGTLLNTWSFPSSPGFNLSIEVDSQGNIYTGDTYNYVQKFDSSFNLIDSWGSYGTGNGQFYGIGDMVIDSLDNVFIIDYDNPRIQKFTSDGTYVTKWGSSGGGNNQFSSSNVNHLAVDSQKNIYVQDAINIRVQKFSNTGTYISQFGSAGAGDMQFWSPWGIAVNSYDQIVIADLGGLAIKTFNQPATFQPESFTSTLSSLTCGTTYHYRSFATNSDGTSYGNDVSFTTSACSATPPDVTTLSATNITQISATINGITPSDGIVERGFQWGTSALYGTTAYDSSSLSPTNSPITVNLTNLTCSTSYHFRAFATNGNGTGYGQNVAFTTADCDYTPEITTLDVTNIDGDSATFSGLVSPRLLATRGFQWSTDSSFGMGTDAEDDLTTPTYTFARSFISYGSNYGQAETAYAVKIDTNNNIYQLDRHNCKVVKYDSDNNFLTEWGGCGSASGQLLSPRAMAIDKFNNIYVADTWNTRIQKFDSEGNYLLEWGSAGSGDGQFSSPRGIAVDNNNNVYVTDINLHRVQKFDSNGAYLGQWGTFGTGNSQFNVPVGVATDSNNHVYISEYGGNTRIQKFDSEGNYLLQITPDNGEQFGRLAIDSQDNLFAGEGISQGIQKFDSNGNFISEWSSIGTGEGQIDWFGDLTFDRLDNMYVADAYSFLQIKKYMYGIDLTTSDNLLCGTQYYVRAFSTTNNNTPGGTGQTMPFSTSACPGTPPGPPGNLRITSADGTNATLVWDTPTDPGSSPVTDYLIEFRQASENAWTPYPNTVSTNTYETVTSLNPGITYYFRTFAVSNDGVSQPSNEIELSYTIDLSLSTSLMNTGRISAGDTVTYRNTLSNNGPGSSTFSDVNIPIVLHVAPIGFNYAATSSSNVGCAEAPIAITSAYLNQFYGDTKAIYCFLTNPITLTAGQNITYDIIGTTDANFVSGATIRGLGINFFEAHRELVEFDNQLEILSGIFMAFGGDFSQPSSSTNIFTLPWNNVTNVSYTYSDTPTTPSPSPTVTTNTTPSPTTKPPSSPTSSTSPTSTPTPTIQPEPELPNPLFPKYPPEGVQVPKKDTPPTTTESSFLTGFIPEGILDTIRMTPNAVALVLPFFIILILIALAVLYARQAWLEYRTISKVRGIIERYHSTKEASQNFVALTSHYLNTPVNILQASAELLASTKALSKANIDKLNLAIKNLAEDIKKLVTESQKTTSRVAESTTELDKLKLKNPLLSIFVIIPSGIVLLILFILNLLFTATDRYSLSFTLVVAQITALVLGVGILALSWHSYKRNQASRDALKHQLTLEADILARRVAFITQSYSDLNADLGLVKALTKGIPKENAAQKTLQNGITMLEDVLQTFGRLINFSRPLETLPAPLSIAPVIDSALKNQKDALAQKNIAVESRVPVNLTAPLTQEAAEQLISSIIDNAIKFNKENGSLKISTKSTKKGTAITFIDTGIGIDKTKLSQLMTPFSRATDVLKFDYEGIGLNLYLDKVLLEQIGGELHISSAQNKGTTVTLTIPEVKA